MDSTSRPVPIAVHPAAELCVVIPVLNEEANIGPLVERLDAVLGGIAWEAIFVDDDSTDATRAAVAAIGAHDPRVRLLHRIGRRGLSSAFIEGAQASLAPCVAAMDGDLQHDETLLPRMFSALRDGGCELAIGSRYVGGGGVGDWDRRRAGMSSLATKLSRIVLRAPVTDPMSGFFMIRRDTFERAVRNLSALGFKILLDILASLPSPPVVVELPYEFRLRTAGESKLDAGVLRDYLMLIADKLVGHIVPVRFVLFALIGGLGVIVNLVVLRLGLGVGLRFTLAEAVATLAAMVSNFLLNNQLTYRDRRLKRWRLVRGLITFCIGCSVGAVANVGIALQIASEGRSWWLAGLAGALIGAVWNYAIASTYTWGRAR